MLCPCRAKKNLTGTEAATACASVPGYTLQADTNWYGTPGVTLEGQLPSADLAKAKCDADPQCTHWNNWGYWMNGPAKNYGPYEGLCIYSKPNCEVHPGYEVKPNTNWYPAAGSTQGKFDTGSQAKAKCDSDSGCTHWNNYGYTMNGASANYFPYEGLCIYKKTKCPEKPGYMLQTDKNWIGTPGVTKEGQLNGGDAAKAKCDSDPACTHWNNWGYWMNGPASQYIPYEGLCIYRKSGATAGVTVYQEKNFAGKTINVGIGEYSRCLATPPGGNLPLKNDTLRSIKIPPGFKVTVGEHCKPGPGPSGIVKSYTSDVGDLGDLDLKASYIKVESIV